MATIHKSIFEAMKCLNEERLSKAMQVADKRTPCYRKVREGLKNNNWGQYVEAPEYKRWLKTEQKRNPRLSQDNRKRVEAWAQSIKTSLPACCYPSDFAESVGTKGYNKGKHGCWREQKFCQLTGLVVTDIDHVPNPMEVYGRWKASMDFKKEGILAVFITPSGEGLKIVTKARRDWGNLIDQQYEVASILGVELFVDSKTKDASRDSFVPMTGDLLYKDDELFTYSDPEYDKMYGDAYRRGETGPTKPKWRKLEQEHNNKQSSSPVATEPSASEVPVGQHKELPKDYHGVSWDAICRQLDKAIGTVSVGDRHDTAMKKAAPWVQSITDNNPDLMTHVMEKLEFIRNWTDRSPNELENIVSHVSSKPRMTRKPKELVEALKAAGVEDVSAMADPMTELPFDDWADEVERMFDIFPCLREICEPHPRRLWPFLLFASAAFLGTLMTLCYYYFYDMPEKKRRLNYNVSGIGDPASGKSALNRIYELLAEPIVQADKLMNDALNQWKEESRGKSTTKDKKPRPKGIVRIHGARTSNTVFITDMVNAVVEVDGEEMHESMLTVDTEMDNNLMSTRGDNWLNKAVMELKAFHNEEDSQQYANLDSVSGPFNVYWNIICTGTPWALSKKVNEKNFASGLPTRMAVIPVPPTNFKMMPLKKHSETAAVANTTLRDWAYRLDKRSGELPLWQLVEYCWHWTDDRMAIAGFNKDKADEMLIKRVAYYGLAVSAPFIDMRHWDEREKTGTYEVDDKDKRLCSLALDIQYRCQLFWFYQYASQYFENQTRDAAQYRRRTTRYEQCYRQLPKEFTTELFVKTFGYENSNSAQKALARLQQDGFIERTTRGNYIKLREEIN